MLFDGIVEVDEEVAIFLFRQCQLHTIDRGRVDTIFVGPLLGIVFIGFDLSSPEGLSGVYATLHQILFPVVVGVTPVEELGGTLVFGRLVADHQRCLSICQIVVGDIAIYIPVGADVIHSLVGLIAGLVGSDLLRAVGVEDQFVVEVCHCHIGGHIFKRPGGQCIGRIEVQRETGPPFTHHGYFLRIGEA